MVRREGWKGCERRADRQTGEGKGRRRRCERKGDMIGRQGIGDVRNGVDE